MRVQDMYIKMYGGMPYLLLDKVVALQQRMIYDIINLAKSSRNPLTKPLTKPPTKHPIKLNIKYRWNWLARHYDANNITYKDIMTVRQQNNKYTITDMAFPGNINPKVKSAEMK